MNSIYCIIYGNYVQHATRSDKFLQNFSRAFSSLDIASPFLYQNFLLGTIYRSLFTARKT